MTSELTDPAAGVFRGNQTSGVQKKIDPGPVVLSNSGKKTEEVSFFRSNVEPCIIQNHLSVPSSGGSRMRKWMSG